mgnify:CR=1 FL=1|eukprot:scaffold151379_cov33-Tisochrysis_lutea.AAC.2
MRVHHALNAANKSLCSNYILSSSMRVLLPRPPSNPSLDFWKVAKVGSFVPSLVLCGAGDALIPPEKSRALAELLASASNTARTAPAIHQVPSTSHQLMQEDPPVVNKLIDGFLVSLSG